MVTRNNFVCKQCVRGYGAGVLSVDGVYFNYLCYSVNGCTISVKCIFKTSGVCSLVWFLRRV